MRGGAGIYWDSTPGYYKLREPASIGPAGVGRTTLAASILTNTIPGILNLSAGVRDATQERSERPPILPAREALGPNGLVRGLQIGRLQRSKEQPCDVGFTRSPVVNLTAKLLAGAPEILIFQVTQEQSKDPPLRIVK